VRPIVVDDLASSDLIPPDHRQWLMGHGITQTLFVPLIMRRQPIGAFAIHHTRARSYTYEALEFAQALANQATLALRLTRLGEQAKRAAVLEEQEKAAQERAVELARVNEALELEVAERKRTEAAMRSQAGALASIVERLTSESELSEVLKRIVTVVTEQLNAPSSSLWVYEPEKGYVQPVALYEHGQAKLGEEMRGYPAYDEKIALPSGSALLARVIEQRQPVHLEDLACETSIGPRHLGHLLRQGVRSLLIVPLVFGSRGVGVISIRSPNKAHFHQQRIEAAQGIAHLATLAIQIARLGDKVREAAVLEERDRMARDLHDTLAQGFTGIIVQSEAAKGALTRLDADEAERHVRRAEELARHSLHEARRSLRALRPAVLEELDLATAFDRLIEEMTSATSLHAQGIVVGPPRRLPHEWDENLLHIGQEALTNTLRHAQASSFEADLVYDEDRLRLRLYDDGCGFDVGAAQPGLGLAGVRERVGRMKGELIITSAPGRGTEILVTVRYPEEMRG
jgi:signal transduction histidine kinase